MMRAIQLAVACVAVLVAIAGRVQAGSFNNSIGLFNPVQTITFDEFVFRDGTPITNEYSSLGVTFSPRLYYNVQPGSIPNMAGNSLYNGTFDNPFSISFSTVHNEAAFALITNPGWSTFTALLGGTVVESFSAPTNYTSTTNYFGFQGISFDAIQVFAGGSNGVMILDNLQFGNPTIVPALPVVPEPTSLAVFGIGA